VQILVAKGVTKVNNIKYQTIEHAKVATCGGKWLGLRKMGEKKVEGDGEALMWRHVCIIVPLTLAKSSSVNAVYVNLTKMIKLYTF